MRQSCAHVRFILAVIPAAIRCLVREADRRSIVHDQHAVSNSSMRTIMSDMICRIMLSDVKREEERSNKERKEER